MNSKIVKTTLIATFSMMMIACSSNKQGSSSQQNSNQNQSRQDERQRPSTAQLMAQMDTNKDGKLSKSEVKGPLLNDFSKIDTNEDGFLSETELENAPKGKQRPRN